MILQRLCINWHKLQVALADLMELLLRHTYYVHTEELNCIVKRYICNEIQQLCYKKLYIN